MLCYQTYKTKTNLLRASELVFLQWCISEFSSLSKKKKRKTHKKVPALAPLVLFQWCELAAETGIKLESAR